MAKNITAIRLSKGMQQQELAKKAEVDIFWLNKIENGRGTPSIAVLKRIAAALDVEVKDLF